MRRNNEDNERMGPLSALAIWCLGTGRFSGMGYLGPRFAKDGGGDGGGAADDEEEVEDPPADKGGKGKGKDKTELDDEDKPKFSQKKLNALLAEERKKDAATQKAKNDELLKSKNLTEKQRKELEADIKRLKEAMTTKEEAAEEEKRALIKQHEEEKGNLTAESEGWRKAYFKQRVEAEIATAAAKHDGKPKQLVKMLSRDAVLEPRRDKAGEIIKKDGEVVYDLFVPHEEEDPKTKEVKTKKLTVEQKIAAMATSEEDANLFNSNRRGGTGHRQGSGGSGGGNSGNLTPAAKIGRGLAAKFSPR